MTTDVGYEYDQAGCRRYCLFLAFCIIFFQGIVAYAGLGYSSNMLYMVTALILLIFIGCIYTRDIEKMGKLCAVFRKSKYTFKKHRRLFIITGVCFFIVVMIVTKLLFGVIQDESVSNFGYGIAFMLLFPCSYSMGSIAFTLQVLYHIEKKKEEE